MSEVKFAEDGAREAIKEVRQDASATNWVLCGYDASNAVALQGKGEGGLAELQSRLDEKQIQYGLCRVGDVVDGHATTKFVFLVFLGAQVKTVAKARVTTHRGAVKDFFGQAHVTVDAATAEEASEEAIMARVTDASGTSVRVLKDETAGNREQGDRRVVGMTKKSAGPLEIREREAAKEALGRVRGGQLSWALLAYEAPDSSSVALAGSGTGGAEELAAHLTRANVAVGLLRVVLPVDGNEVTRFVLVSHVGADVPGMLKAQKVTHRGQLLEFVGQYHTDVASETPGDVTSAVVEDAVARAAGTKDHQTQALASKSPRTAASHVAPAPNAGAAAAAAAPKKLSTPGASLVTTPKRGNAVNTSSVTLGFEDRPGIAAALAAVRADASPNDWALIGYAGDAALKLVGSGAGGADEMARHVEDPATGCYYGLVRVPTVVDGQNLVRFVFIIYLGDGIKVIRKAKIATHKGAVTEVVGQYHLDLTVASPAELSSEAVAKAVSVNTFESTRK